MLEGARKVRQVRMLGSATEHTGTLEVVAKLDLEVSSGKL